MFKAIVSSLFITGLFSFNAAFAQQPEIGCMDKAIRLQSEQIKQDFKAQGMEVYKDAMISMESRQPFPIAVKLEKGQMYQIVFVGNKDASRYDFELFDGQDNKIDERTLKTPLLSNYIVYSFIPERTDVYLMVLTHRYRSKTFCNSFTIMQKSKPKPKPPVEAPAPPPAKKSVTPAKKGGR